MDEDEKKDQPKAAHEDGESQSDVAPPRARRHVVRLAGLVGWGILLGLVYALAIKEPGAGNGIAAGGLTLVFVLVNVQMIVARWLGSRSLQRLSSKLHGSAYLSELANLPNRNYLLAELRREMPRSRSIQAPFVLIQLSIDEIGSIRERRGGDFADRAVGSLADTLKRLTRSSDFIAHLAGARFCVMLVECTREQSWIYMKRVPGAIPVSDGLRMLDVTVTARIHEYDLESVYATDVLREVETAKPLRRKEEPRVDSIAA